MPRLGYTCKWIVLLNSVWKGLGGISVCAVRGSGSWVETKEPEVRPTEKPRQPEVVDPSCLVELVVTKAELTLGKASEEITIHEKQ